MKFQDKEEVTSDEIGAAFAQVSHGSQQQHISSLPSVQPLLTGTREYMRPA